MTEEILIHNPSRGEFVVVPRATAQMASLSWAARGFLTYCLSLPANWSLNEAHLISQAPSGRDHLRSIVKELEQSGYLTRVRSRSSGQVKQMIWEVWSTPKTEKPSEAGSPATEKPTTEKPTTENRLLQKKQRIQSKEVKRSTTASSSAVQANPTLFSVPLKSGEDYQIDDASLYLSRVAYGADVVDGELPAIACWLDANPAKRKTKRGMPAFLNAWFKRAYSDKKRSELNGPGNLKGQYERIVQGNGWEIANQR